MSLCSHYSIRPEVLDKIRAEQSLESDESLARHLGLTLGTVSRLRRGHRPSLETLICVLDAARVDNLNAAIIRHDALEVA